MDEIKAACANCGKSLASDVPEKGRCNLECSRCKCHSSGDENARGLVIDDTAISEYYRRNRGQKQ